MFLFSYSAWARSKVAVLDVGVRANLAILAGGLVGALALGPLAAAAALRMTVE